MPCCMRLFRGSPSAIAAAKNFAMCRLILSMRDLSSRSERNIGCDDVSHRRLDDLPLDQLPVDVELRQALPLVLFRKEQLRPQRVDFVLDLTKLVGCRGAESLLLVGVHQQRPASEQW